MSHLNQIHIPENATRKVGVVESDQRDKTRKVAIRYSVKHPKYNKYVRRATHLHVHDEENESRTGDRVEVAQRRPLSKTKAWVLVKVLEKAPEGPGYIAETA